VLHLDVPAGRAGTCATTKFSPGASEAQLGTFELNRAGSSAAHTLIALAPYRLRDKPEASSGDSSDLVSLTPLVQLVPEPPPSVVAMKIAAA
jgi:hypothetical protein